MVDGSDSLMKSFAKWALENDKLDCFSDDLKKLAHEVVDDKPKEKEAVNHPSHYNRGNIEVIEFIADQGWGEGFCLGNAVKYIARAVAKDPSKYHEDLEKAEWYIRWWRENRERF